MKATVHTFKKRAVTGHCISTITAYDAITASLVEKAGIPLILVGDSVGTTLLGFGSTVPVTMEMMLHHVQCVRRGAPETFIVADMPFGSYQLSDEQAVANAVRFIQSAGADAVKLEGGADYAPLIKRLVSMGIPVMAHIGLLPQQVMSKGGYFKCGKEPQDVQRLLNDAHAVAEAGAFMTVLECVESSCAQTITDAVPNCTCGIGSGDTCDAQIQVIYDVLGYGVSGRYPKHAVRLADMAQLVSDALNTYRKTIEKND